MSKSSAITPLPCSSTTVCGASSRPCTVKCRRTPRTVTKRPLGGKSRSARRVCRFTTTAQAASTAAVPAAAAAQRVGEEVSRMVERKWKGMPVRQATFPLGAPLAGPRDDSTLETAMRFRTLFLFLVLALTAVFALLDWPTFTAPTTLSLVFGTVQAPLGVIMLGLVFLLGAMCLSYLVFVQGTALVDSRRHAKELQAHRDLAENAEASRFTELHNFVNAELRKMEEMH